MMFREITAVYSDDNTNPTGLNTIFGQPSKQVECLHITIVFIKGLDDKIQSIFAALTAGDRSLISVLVTYNKTRAV
jgi:hypothetical protein